MGNYFLDSLYSDIDSLIIYSGIHPVQKLLSLFTPQQRKPAYEFLPYKFGAFSFQTSADKGTLIKYGQLKDSKHWVFFADEGGVSC